MLQGELKLYASVYLACMQLAPLAMYLSHNRNRYISFDLHPIYIIVF